MSRLVADQDKLALRPRRGLLRSRRVSLRAVVIAKAALIAYVAGISSALRVDPPRLS